MGDRPVAMVYDPLSWVSDFSYEVEAEILARHGIELVVPASPAEREGQLPDAAVVIAAGTASLGAAELAQMRSCEGVVAASAGLDHIDLEAAVEAGIPVVNVTTSTDEVADHAMALVLAALRRVVAFNTAAENRDWRPLELAQRQELRRLRGQVMGIIGAGRVGRSVASRAHGFGFEILATARRPLGESHVGTLTPDAMGRIDLVPLPTLLERSDVIVVCADANRTSVGLLDAGAFGAMKDGVVVVNVSRGAIIDESALADAIESGKVSFAALDVRHPEPPDPRDDRLTGNPRVIQTPHVGGASQQAREDLHRMTAERVVDLLEGARLPSSPMKLTEGVDMSSIHHLDELEAIARTRLAEATYGYVTGGAGLERAIRHNREGLDRLKLVPRVMRDVRDVSTRTSLLGTETAFPLILAPSAVQRLSHPDGELATARAARDAGLTMVLSMNASTTMEEVAAVGVDFWMQLYFSPDREHMTSVLQRAQRSGARALCLTVDHMGTPTRLRELHRPLVVPPDVEFVHLPKDPARRGVDRGLTWEVIEWIRGVTEMPIVLKGVLHPDDGRIAAETGVDAVIVSNHGGRQLDGAVSAYDVLVPFLEAVDGRMEVYADGGIRSGTDLLKVLALGARVGLIGRPIWWGLAAGGEAGVARVLEVVCNELTESMRLCGVATTAEIDRGLLLGFES